MLSAAESSNRLSCTSRIRYARIPEVLPIPNLIELQLDSFKWFVDKGCASCSTRSARSRTSPAR